MNSDVFVNSISKEYINFYLLHNYVKTCNQSVFNGIRRCGSASIVLGVIILFLAPNTVAFSQLNSELEKAQRDQVEKSYDYTHLADTDRATVTTLLNGLNLTENDYILLYDSTPFASKGHVALTLPCSVENPKLPDFQILVGEAPDIFNTGLGYIAKLSSPPRECLYHAQFGFGDPVTDVALKYTGKEPIVLNGPYAVTITTHESYIPTQPSLLERLHQNQTGY